MKPSDKLTFRPAVLDDLPELLHFPQSEEELFYFFPSAHYPLTLKQLQKQISERHQSTAMLNNAQLLGFANFYNVENRKIAFIGNIIIRPEARQKGYGAQLLEHMIQQGFQSLKLKEIHLSCFNQNTKALLFYQQRGFSPYAWEVRKDYQQRDVIMLHLKLKNPAIKPPL